MGIISVVLLFGFIKSLEAIHCDKIFNYHENYGYGFDIICEGLSNRNKEMLVDISVSNEIVLTINNSNLSEVTPNLFQNVSKIRFLIIKNSLFVFNPNEYIFANLLSLEHLIFENTVFSSHNLYVLQDLDKLRELSFVNTNLEIINNGTFRNLQKIETLTLTNNRFENMSEIPFCELPALKYLHLDRNKVKQVSGNFTSCFRKKETNLKLNGMRYTILSENVHQSKSETSLLDLNVSNNQIEFIDNFDWALRLRHIDLSNNRLENVSKKIFSILGDLEKLNLENNFIRIIDSEAFSGLKNLKVINLKRNLLNEVVFKNLPNLEEINLGNNNLKPDSLTTFNNLPKLQSLILHNNFIKKMPPNNFTSLEVLDLSSNSVILQNSVFKNLGSLKHLNLKNNSLENIPVEAFLGLVNLEILDISVNKVEIFENPHVFVDLYNLKILNMSDNNIQHLNYDLVKPLRNLQVLDISGNKLQSFQINVISLLPSLQIINIRSNLLSCSVLSKIIVFLKNKHIDYTINEEFEYDKQNIGGIYCKEMSSSVRGLSSPIAIIFLVVAISVFISFTFYRCLLFSKRRRYFMDEMELI
ncbi:leucine-rich repeat-containing protein 15-like [Tribolium madens]|uniref:leucine-rich repeat-containing protein 15-like n=1 Tax=Tribolium madens TaxID=41895 RepID=UPI001CF76371|nr:leucine-rich repeat-containing protein 15-like [Tribolium madens]